jgi:hypothetical protein
VRSSPRRRSEEPREEDLLPACHGLDLAAARRDSAATVVTLPLFVRRESSTQDPELRGRQISRRGVEDAGFVPRRGGG